MDTKYDPELVKPLKAELVALLAAAPFDTYVSVRAEFRALKVSGPREEVRLAGPGIRDRNEIAYGTVRAAGRRFPGCQGAWRDLVSGGRLGRTGLTLKNEGAFYWRIVAARGASPDHARPARIA